MPHVRRIGVIEKVWSDDALGDRCITLADVLLQKEPDKLLIPLNSRCHTPSPPAAGHDAIRQPHLPVFELIDRDCGSRLTTLAARANITPQAMGELVAYLERHGYIERAPDLLDGWAKLARLTERGLELSTLVVRRVKELEILWRRISAGMRFSSSKRSSPRSGTRSRPRTRKRR
jgi:DNA-binding MarR family transcriptional regulator